ncbi:coatomer subunit beta-like [Tropilaelaps mercedesae]|uniref:Coatomer subunit beta n=1 Tax=Tropilaelaps mercedesae TaxID=418985 RepID=A0A1V9XQF8_9ACAR|nr:coatomer subunit beta-like [Tropilaelaps mercedesae]
MANDSLVPGGPCFILLARTADLDSANDVRLRLELEKGDIGTKIRALNTLVRLCVLEPTRLSCPAGRPTLMAVIRFLLPLQDHAVKRLLLLFWEVVPKSDTKGEPLQEMILVCDSFRRDLEHPNEFIRGATLRLLTKFPWHGELLEPLYPSVVKCLKHRHSYVRRNAVLCLFHMGKHCRQLQAGVITALDTFLSTDHDASANRNAFLALCKLDDARALRYVEETDWSNAEALERSGRHLLQGPAAQLIYRTGLQHPQDSWRFIQSVFHMMRSPTPSARFEAARILFRMTSANTAIRTAGQTLVDLAVSHADNGAKLVLLNTLGQLRQKHSRPLGSLAAEVVRVVPGASDVEVRRSALALAVALSTEYTAPNLIELLKQELRRLQTSPHHQADTAAASEAVLEALQSCLASFPETTSSVITCLTELVSSESESVSLSAVRILRETLVRFPEYASRAVSEVLLHFPLLRGASVLRQASWLLGEFCTSPEHISEFIEQVSISLGEKSEAGSSARNQRECNGVANDFGMDLDEVRKGTRTSPSVGSVPLEKKSSPMMTADGSYATQSVFSMTSDANGRLSWTSSNQALRSHLLKGDFFLGACICGSVTKAACRLVSSRKVTAKEDECLGSKRDARINIHETVVRGLRIIASCLALADSGLAAKRATADDRLRMGLCVQLLLQAQLGKGSIHGLGGGDVTRRALNSFVESDRKRGRRRRREGRHIGILETALGERQDSTTTKQCEEADAAILFDQLSTSGSRLGGHGRAENQDIFSVSLRKALSGNLATSAKDDDLLANSLLAKVTQLTGRGDPVYAECYAHVAAHAIDLDVLIFNQTDDTLQNCTLELTTIGRYPGKRDIKLIERPTPVVIGPHDFVTLRTTIKVTATDNGLVCGNISYDIKGSTSDTHLVVLNDIRINIVDFLVAHETSENDFRKMWAELEWENKISVATSIQDLDAFLDLLLRQTNMACIQRGDKRLSGDASLSDFLVANLSAQSLFAENALANVCLAKDPVKGQLSGSIRVRAQSQGLALCLGDKIAEVLKYAKI